MMKYFKIQGVTLWYSGLRVWHCYCSGPGCCCGVDSVPGPETYTCCRCCQKKKKKKAYLTSKANRERRTNKTKVSRMRESIKIREDISEIETKKIIEKTNETKSWFSEKIKKIDKPLARLIKKKRESVQINKIRNEKEVIMDITEIQSILRDYCKQLCTKIKGQPRRIRKILTKVQPSKMEPGRNRKHE